MVKNVSCRTNVRIADASVSGLTASKKSARLLQFMWQWKVKASTLWVLGGLVFLMLLILFLPDVDLPDTAFHRGTAPVVVHANANSAPAPLMVASVQPLHGIVQYALALHLLSEFDLTLEPNFRPILLRSIRC